MAAGRLLFGGPPRLAPRAWVQPPLPPFELLLLRTHFRASHNCAVNNTRVTAPLLHQRLSDSQASSRVKIGTQGVHAGDSGKALE
jgi:hypothetical protein